MTTTYTSVITTTFVPAATDVSVVGYFSSDNNEVGTIVCPDGYEFLVSSTYGICCDIGSSGNCDFKQYCSDSVVHYSQTSVTCPNNNPCLSTTLYQNSPSNGASATMAWCMDYNDPDTIYRSFVGTQLTLVTGDAPPTTAVPESTATSPDIPSTTTTTTPTPTDTSTESLVPVQTTPSDSGSKTNVGAIAGGVVGGVAGLALIVAAIWFVWRRQAKKNAEMREIGTGYTAPAPK